LTPGVPPLGPFVRGARLFDGGAFFEAHEAWEERWLVESDPTWRELLQGLIQVAAGFHKLFVTKDRASAARLLTKGLAKLERCPEEIAGVALGRFREEARACSASLEKGVVPSTTPKLGV
jgi:predicted metal-dependent hydrolase